MPVNYFHGRDASALAEQQDGGQAWSVEQTRAPVLMDRSNRFTEAAIFAGKTVKRLQREGHSADDAKRMVAAVINAEEFAIMTGRHSSDVTRFIERLRQLPN